MKPSSSRLAYREALKRRGKRFALDMQTKRWCDLWHTHFDWDGQGNRSWLDRRRHLGALFTALSRARAELTEWKEPHQLFATVHPANSADDALYVHTPNPNGTAFPYVFEDAKELAAVPRLLVGKVRSSEYMVYAVGSGKDRSFIVVPRET